jgi:hypothetical protein
VIIVDLRLEGSLCFLKLNLRKEGVPVATFEDESDASRSFGNHAVHSAFNTFLSDSVDIFRYDTPRVDRGIRQKC